MQVPSRDPSPAIVVRVCFKISRAAELQLAVGAGLVLLMDEDDPGVEELA